MRRVYLSLRNENYAQSAPLPRVYLRVYLASLGGT